MAELSDLYSSKTSPVRIAAITDGASLGLIDTDRIWPTTSSCGTVRFIRTTSATQPTMIGIASRRIHFAKTLLRVCSAAAAGSIVGALTTKPPRYGAPTQHSWAPWRNSSLQY
jgi:hypothetical protein